MFNEWWKKSSLFCAKESVFYCPSFRAPPPRPRPSTSFVSYTQQVGNMVSDLGSYATFQSPHTLAPIRATAKLGFVPKPFIPIVHTNIIFVCQLHIL